MPINLVLQFDPVLADLVRLDARVFHEPTWDGPAYQSLWKAGARGLLACVQNGAGATGLEPVGFLVYHTLVDEVEILRLGVVPQARRQGVGQQLLQAGLGIWHAQGMARVFLEVRASNAAAQALYLKAGFSQVGLRKRYYQDNQEDACVLALDLNP